MVSRPLPTRTSYKHDSNSSTLPKDQTEEEKRLTEKFATHRRLVPLVSQNDDVLFLNAASAPPSNLIVHEAITKYSASALYSDYPHPQWRETREEARALIARLINAETPETIAFTRDTTEGLGSVIRSLRFERGDNVVVVDTEHPNQVYAWLALRDAGLEVRFVPTIAQAEEVGFIDAVDADTLRPYVDKRTRAIGLSSVSFDSGQRNDVAGISAAFRPAGIHILIDAAQHVANAQLDVQADGVSAAVFTLHKAMNCPTGIGALYVAPEAHADLVSVPPIVSMQGVRNMSENLVVKPDEPVEYYTDARRFEHANMSLVGVVAAAAFARVFIEVLGPADVEAWLYYLTELLRAECERLGVRVLGPREKSRRAPHIVILDLDTKVWAAHLRDYGRVRYTVNRLGFRISFGFFNSVEDVKRFVRVLELGIARGLVV
ncbi:hypothetical protein M426DRAFT_197746 [Hypoxylon sp. CI-4A]|nr:hypothetical protein M426DRAFT_197746 [Hypoxylon sp. CI-4A]